MGIFRLACFMNEIELCVACNANSANSIAMLISSSMAALRQDL